jgi:hypothetical protein
VFWYRIFVEFIVLEKLVLGDRFLNGFIVKMANRVFDPCGRLNNMMRIRVILMLSLTTVSVSTMAKVLRRILRRQRDTTNSQLIRVIRMLSITTVTVLRMA